MLGLRYPDTIPDLDLDQENISTVDRVPGGASIVDGDGELAQSQAVDPALTPVLYSEIVKGSRNYF